MLPRRVRTRRRAAGARSSSSIRRARRARRASPLGCRSLSHTRARLLDGATPDPNRSEPRWSIRVSFVPPPLVRASCKEESLAYLLSLNLLISYRPYRIIECRHLHDELVVDTALRRVARLAEHDHVVLAARLARAGGGRVMGERTGGRAVGRAVGRAGGRADGQAGVGRSSPNDETPEGVRGAGVSRAGSASLRRNRRESTQRSRGARDARRRHSTTILSTPPRRYFWFDRRGFHFERQGYQVMRSRAET